MTSYIIQQVGQRDWKVTFLRDGREVRGTCDYRQSEEAAKEVAEETIARMEKDRGVRGPSKEEQEGNA